MYKIPPSRGSVARRSKNETEQAPPISWSAKMEQAFETLSENRTSTREESLEAIVDAFSTHHVSSYIDNRHEEVLGLLKRSLSKYNNPKEASLAARAIALTFINLDDISEGDSDNYYKRIVPSLKNAIMDSEEVDVKVDCLHTLALITYISASDADTKITRDYIFDLIETEGAEFNIETLSTNDKDSFIAEAIKAYGILYAASFSKGLVDFDALWEELEKVMPMYEILLESSDKDIRMATGENIALIFETAHVFTATDEDEEEYDEDETVKPEYENMNELVRTLKDLSVESNKRKTKSDRAEQKSMFRDILKSVEENVRPEEELKIGNRIIVFRGWSKILVLNAIRRTLGHGLQHHLKTNSLLKQIFNYSTGISSQQDDEDESEEEEEVLSNVDRRYFYDETKKIRSKQLRLARLGKENALV
ncbi:hypothetical protein RMATCC62417_02847 [Rhizopus microsporus]|nr:hypothetical protein RMATCC62417_02847 [Rhizopus microsporus]